MILFVALAVAGLLLLTVAADHLIIGAGRVAARLRVAPVVVGVVVIGFGTSAPEFLVSGLAAAQGNAEIAVGNLIGSNILNLTLVLGVAALIRPFAIGSTVVRREGPMMVAAMAVFALAAGIHLGVATGMVLAVLTIAALFLLIRLARTTADPTLPPEVSQFLDESRRHLLGRELVRTVAGLAGVMVGAQLLVANAELIATRIGVPQFVIGFTLVAIGTSLPELVTAIQAQRHGETDLLVGNVLGSNLFNSLAGGAIVGLASGSRATMVAWPLLVAMLLVGLLAWALLSRRRVLTRGEGVFLLLAYALTLPLLQ